MANMGQFEKEVKAQVIEGECLEIFRESIKRFLIVIKRKPANFSKICIACRDFLESFKDEYWAATATKEDCSDMDVNEQPGGQLLLLLNKFDATELTAASINLLLKELAVFVESAMPLILERMLKANPNYQSINANKLKIIRLSINTLLNQESSKQPRDLEDKIEEKKPRPSP